MHYKHDQKKEPFMYHKGFAQMSARVSPSDALKKVLQVKLVAFHQLPATILVGLPASAQIHEHIPTSVK